ncbi:uncharacterized protein LOC106702352 isoform X2 [Latimeria chalumnae]|uniref:uncharacterized protein LOC106702352 isoform X2 n=1 Tax=Latimeria chalumnae TaxID=7897 RepID=UPI00313B945C
MIVETKQRSEREEGDTEEREELCQDMKTMECAFCHGTSQNQTTGKLFIKKGVAAHQNCMLFSSNLVTSDSQDFEDFAGFQLKDVKAEIRRGRRLKCSYCKKLGASVGCEVPSCRRSYHYPCAVKDGAKIVQKEEEYKIYCKDHRMQRSRNKRQRTNGNNQGVLEDDLPNGHRGDAAVPGTSESAVPEASRWNWNSDDVITICSSDDDDDEDEKFQAVAENPTQDGWSGRQRSITPQERSTSSSRDSVPNDLRNLQKEESSPVSSSDERSESLLSPTRGETLILTNSQIEIILLPASSQETTETADTGRRENAEGRVSPEPIPMELEDTQVMERDANSGDDSERTQIESDDEDAGQSLPLVNPRDPGCPPLLNQTQLRQEQVQHGQQQCRLPHIALPICLNPALEEPLLQGERSSSVSIPYSILGLSDSAPEAQTSLFSNMAASPLKHCSVKLEPLNVQTTPSPAAERCTSSSSSQNLLHSLSPGTHMPQSASILSPLDSPGPSPTPSDVSESSHNILPPSASIEPSHDAPPTSPSIDLSHNALPTSPSSELSNAALPLSTSIDPSHDAPPTSPSSDTSHNALPPSTDPSHNALPPSPSTDPSHNALPPSPSTDPSHDASSTSVSIDPSHNALRSSISRKPSHNASPPSTLIGAGEPGQGGTSPFQTDHPKEGPMLCKCLDMVHKKMKTISQQLSSISTRLGALEDRLAQTAPLGTISDCPVDQRCSAVGGPSPAVMESLASGSQGAACSPRRGPKRRGPKRRGYFLIPYMLVKKVCKRKKM